MCIDLTVAVVPGGYWLAIPAVRAIHDHGVSVPDDISLMEMGDSEAVAYFSTLLRVMNERKMDIGIAQVAL